MTDDGAPPVDRELLELAVGVARRATGRWRRRAGHNGVLHEDFLALVAGLPVTGNWRALADAEDESS